MITMIGHNNDLFEGKCYYALICLTGRLIFYSLPGFWGEGSIAKVLKKFGKEVNRNNTPGKSILLNVKVNGSIIFGEFSLKNPPKISF